MKILAIETSCDETGIAILEGTKDGESFSFTVLGNALLSQAALHAEYGGVFPALAKREHIKNLPPMLEQALKQAGEQTLDAIAVTYGPGLEPALWTGITFAQKLAAEWGLPLLPINHMEGHLISSLVQNGKLEHVALPVLGLLISGGHTEFALMKDWFDYTLVGQTKDDAVGEAFDKVARMLGLSYPGGPEISKLAEYARQNNITSDIKLPRPMLHEPTCDFSFSGLKTAVLYALRDLGGMHTLSSDHITAFAREFEDAVSDVLIAKTRRALEQTDSKTFVIGGGVAASKHLRRTLGARIEAEFPNVEFRLPALDITGDNAVMIAMAALARMLSGAEIIPPPETIAAKGSLSLQTAK
ncbi:MAG: tRNA (adenosine(37)-N6)-threonylcarbamoyltransferase complex transferase subunit TsaD [Candidatus Adlerbacteria bacterium]|nr:tRNA (adenosine(37)-N6)-threonylcarbamoyltransferase complex transferase subunit TsaD [Candidatus Adlerbacteria bacterium]